MGLSPLSTVETSQPPISTFPTNFPSTKEDSTAAPTTIFINPTTTGRPTTQEDSTIPPASSNGIMSTTAEDLTTVNLENEKAAAEAAKEAAEEALEQAEETKAAAEEASSTTSEVNAKISELIGSLTTAGSNRKRRAVGTTASYDTPTDCAGFITMVADMTTAISGENYSTATKIGTALVSVDSDAVSCSSDEISSLEDQQTAIVAVQTELTAAIAVLDTTITTQTSLIETINETIEALIAAIIAALPTDPPSSTLVISASQEQSTIIDSVSTSE